MAFQSFPHTGNSPIHIDKIGAEISSYFCLNLCCQWWILELPENSLALLQFHYSLQSVSPVNLVYFSAYFSHSVHKHSTHFRALSCLEVNTTPSVHQWIATRGIQIITSSFLWIDTLILKLATNDLCTCSHQAIFSRRCRGAQRFWSLFLVVNSLLFC